MSLDESNTFTPFDEPPSSANKENNNRTFMIVAGVLAGIVLISIACMAVYALVILPRQKAATAAQEATIQAQNAQVAQAMTQTANAALWTPTATPSAVPTATRTLAPTLIATPVATQATAVLSTATETVNPTTQFNLLLTQSADLNKTATGVALATATSLAQTGFVDEFGLPGLAIMAVVLMVVILLARKLRSKPAGLDI